MVFPTLPASTRPDLVDPAELTRLGRIEIVARWIVDGFLTGLHRSARKGFSVEFAEHRPYFLGDDPRFIDWKTAARTDRWLIKQFEEETNLRALVALDVSRSMQWSGDPARLTKLAYAEHLVAAIALLMLRQRDAVGLVRFDDALRSTVPPRSREGQWQRLIVALGEEAGGGESRADLALLRAGQLIRRPGMVVLVSDLLCEPEPLVHAVRALRAARHGVTVMHVMDPAERHLAGGGDALFVDPESHAEVPARVADVRAAYSATVERAIGEWRDALAAAGARYELVLTDEPFGVALRRSFAKRA